MKFLSVSAHLLSSFALRLRALTGWRRIGAGFGFGSVMALAMPPFNLFPLLWLCLPALVFLLQGTQSKKEAFITSWGFAFGFFVFGLYWIAASMFVDLAHFWWAVPLAVAGLPAFFALYYGIAGMIGCQLGLNSLSGIFGLGVLWFCADYARGHLFTGFPWNLEAYSWSDCLPILQSVSVIGSYGLTLLTCVAAILPASLMLLTRTSRVINVLSIASFIMLACTGEMRLQNTSISMTPDVRLRLVQPNIPQTLKWRNSEREKHFQTLIDLTASESAQPITHVFWPETASTYYLSEDAFHRQEIAGSIPAAGAVITGVIRRDLDEAGNTRFYNSLVAVDGMGRLVAGYDKSHLVPFGEYMPLRNILPLKSLAAGDADFSSGTGPRSLRVLGLPLFSPLICYEAIFPGSVIDKEDRPAFIVNLTNDGWYGQTTGPYQHFAIVRARAIEEGLPLIRVANTGISGVIDPLGHILKTLPLGTEGYIDSDLPAPLPATIYGQEGEKLVWYLFAVLCSVGIALRTHERRKIILPE